MTRQATTSTLKTLLSLFEKQQQELKQASACFDVFPAKAGIEFRAVSDRDMGSRENSPAKSRVCRKAGKAEMYS
jgi:hypothetical protein